VGTLLLVLLMYLIAPLIFEVWMRLIHRLRHIWYIEMLWHGSTRWMGVYAVVWGGALWHLLAPQRWNRHIVVDLGGRFLVSVLLVQMGVFCLMAVNPQLWMVDTGYSLSPTIRTGWSLWHLIEVPANILTWAFGITVSVSEGINLGFHSEVFAEMSPWPWIFFFVLFYWQVSWWGIYRRMSRKWETEDGQMWLRVVYWGALGWFAFTLYLSSFWLVLQVGNQPHLLLTVAFWEKAGFCVLLVMGVCLLLTVGLLVAARRKFSTSVM